MKSYDSFLQVSIVTYTFLTVVLVILQPYPLRNAQAEDQSASVSAVDVAKLLQKKGIPITYKITDVSDIEIVPGSHSKAGIVSDARTATKELDISVTVFRNPKLRNEARLRQVKVCPGCAFLAECGSILVSFSDGKLGRSRAEYDRYRKLTRETYSHLKQAYHCE